MRTATQSSGSSSVRSQHPPLRATSSPRASWKTPSRSPTSLPQACTPTYTRPWTISLRYSPGEGGEKSAPPPQRVDSTGLEEHAPVGAGGGAWRGGDWAQSSAMWAKRIPFVTGLLPAPTECNPILSSQIRLGELSLGWAFFGERHGGALCKPPCYLNIPRWRGATLLEI